MGIADQTKIVNIYSFMTPRTTVYHALLHHTVNRALEGDHEVRLANRLIHP